jgi:hypothetical protein
MELYVTRLQRFTKNHAIAEGFRGYNLKKGVLR